MTTPFLGIEDQENMEYPSKVYANLVIFRKERHILMRFPEEVEGLGSSVYGGGMQPLQAVVNIYVDRFYHCADPVRDIEASLSEWGYARKGTAGLLTAVQLQHTAVAEEQDGAAAVVVCATAGISNGARAGVQRTTFPADYVPGTINLMIAVDGRMTPAAMVNAIITATEAKAAALADLHVPDAENGLTATGTTTDAVVIGVSQNPAYEVLHPYAGTASDLGGRIGRLVYAAVTEALTAAGVRR
ncbi:adenosylcobinamide amidohydrolase [Paenibacillus shirakamiensis]|uniref:Adenosylcobinamide amidohydrolase n=1 Tax=Paenibacillus shirakamiensis TaxID=1265935 RepID=A0ABS4JIU5_9BACL|nr:adenosylcobinamide amidohydrolase [Paenibacillus shirakamiensis]MBP2000534.1 adenosylcobinamide amidohydrolase [Paenibacillus shirakamiensis]